MPLFNRIYKLMQSKMARIPLEDYITEIFAAILERDKELRNKFVNEILHIDGNGFSVATQKCYDYSEENKKRPDVVFENKDTLCFLENKVESPEEVGQLDFYSNILLRVSKSNNKNYFLRYCTKYYDPKKSPKNCDYEKFLQFRWHEVSEFLSNYKSDNPLIIEFLSFMKEFGMGKIEKFNEEDIPTMQSLYPIMEKMQNVCDLILPHFVKYFGEISDKKWANQILFRNRYGINSNYGILCPNSSVFVGFEFTHESPILQVLLWYKPDEITLEQSIEELEKKYIFYKWGVDGFGLAYEKSLSTFINGGNHIEAIMSWFEEKMNSLHEFIKGNIKE